MIAMQRREFMTLVGGAAAAWPLAAHAQKSPMSVIGVLESGSATSPTNLTAEFHAGLKEVGYVDGQNVTIEYRRADAHYDRLPALASDLIQRKVALIVASGNFASALTAKAATMTIPIVFLIGADPVQTGLVKSLNRPGGNITGVTIFGGHLFEKQLEMLHQLVPKARAFAVLVNPQNPSHPVDKSFWQRFADSVGVPIEIVTASTEGEFDPTIASLAEKQVDALLVVADTLFGSNSDSLSAVLARHAMPAIFTAKQNAVAGGLLSYGGSYADAKHRLGIYVGRVLKGEKPADLPVLQPTKFDLVINLKTAKALGITIPNVLLIQATELIE
jgi:putative tryptophan/tyrosine transport system substrate-binding protein